MKQHDHDRYPRRTARDEVERREAEAEMRAGDARKIVFEDVPVCPRCRGDHGNQAFEPLDNPTGGISHYCLCPATKQPILRKA